MRKLNNWNPFEKKDLRCRCKAKHCYVAGFGCVDESTASEEETSAMELGITLEDVLKSYKRVPDLKWGALGVSEINWMKDERNRLLKEIQDAYYTEKRALKVANSLKNYVKELEGKWVCTKSGFADAPWTVAE